MAKYVDLNGLGKVWYDAAGSGEPLLMLHPGGADTRAFGPNTPAMAKQFHVFLPERRGHGHTADIDGPLTFDLFVDDTIAFLEQVVGGPARIMGYSDGAIVGIMLAVKRPDLVKQLACVAGVFNYKGWDAGVIDPSQEPPEFMAESYGEVSPDGKEHFAVVAKKLDEEHLRAPALTPADLQKVSCRTLVMIGDDDEVTLEHATEWYRALPKGELAIIPGTSHGLLVEKAELCNKILLDFFSNDAVTTLAPRRRVH